MKKFIEKVMSWYLTRQALPYWTVLLVDVFIVLTSTFVVIAFNLGAQYVAVNGANIASLLAVYAVVYCIAFRLFHTYVSFMRYSSFNDLLQLLYAVVFATVILLPLQGFVLCWLVPLDVSRVAVSSLCVVALLWAERIWAKNLYDSTTSCNAKSRVFIYGVSRSSASLANSLNDESSPYKVVGFISDDECVEHKKIQGADVFSNDEYLVPHMKQRGANILLVTPLKNDSLRGNEAMVNSLIEGGIKIFMTPSAIEDEEPTDLSYTQLHPVNVEDLLPREKIEIDMESVGRLLRGKRILVTGAAGSIGSEIVRRLAPFAPAELILVDQAETPLHEVRLMMKRKWQNIEAHTIVANIANARRMDEIFKTHRPDYVFHAAAYKHVPMMEDNPVESIINNIEGTRIIADAAVRYHTKKFVMISTDKAVNPTNVMGCSKRICEIYVQSLDAAIKSCCIAGETQFVTTRFGNVLGSNGSVVSLFQKQIAEGGPLTVTHPHIIRYFMLIPEACKLVLEAGTMGRGGEIFVFDMGKPVRIADLARRMISLTGAKNIEIQYVGLRDGEKLYEEVLDGAETTLPTFHQKIKIAKVRQYDYEDTNLEITALVNAANSGEDDMSLVARMKAIVPEFKSQHSVYEQLDDNQYNSSQMVNVPVNTPIIPLRQRSPSASV
jgi:FlaA1/EpsC-like NDP-sugar epimerase